MDFDGPVLCSCVATALPEMFAQSWVSPEAFHFIATLLKAPEFVFALFLTNTLFMDLF